MNVCLCMLHSIQVVIPGPGQEHQLLGAEIIVRESDKPMYHHLIDAFVTPETSYTLGLTHQLKKVPQSTLQITDTIMYNGDLIALTRMKYLLDVIDEFIIVDLGSPFLVKSRGKYTFTNLQLMLNFFRLCIKSSML